MQVTTYGATTEKSARIIGIWLLTICSMVFAMVVLGGFTRLTESGLSMTNWRPVTGWLPPLSHGEWMAHFEAYRTSPEYLQINRGMSIDDFKGIFWLEYLHRLWGRIIGLAFGLPLAYFLWRRWVDRALGIRLGGLFLLGGFQGFIGWWMVKSGLVDRPDVSQYRLAVHLIVAFVIIALCLWFALNLLGSERSRVSPTLRRATSSLIALVLITVFSGALVAGLNAGMIYNTFPLMLGEVFPAEGFQLQPWYRNFFEDIPTVQFDHRVLAIATLLLVVMVRFMTRHASMEVQKRAGLLLVAALFQVSLGIATLLMVVPIPLAAAHQAGAVVLLVAAIWLRHGMQGEHA